MIEIWTPEQAQKLQSTLSHVLWIGGATDSGKTTTAALLAEKYQLQVYHGDQHWRENWAKHTPENQPAMHHWDSMTRDECWLRSPDILTTHSLKIATERIPFIVDDLLTMPKSPLIVLEWFGFMPDFIAPLLSNPKQAIWLFHNDAFKQQSIQKRGKANFHRDTSVPRQAWKNHLQRDLKLADIAQNQVTAHEFTKIINNAKASPEAILAQVEAHFAPFLPKIKN